MSYMCPVCGYPALKENPVNLSPSFEICRSCGFEFGISDDDLGFTFDQWRQKWIAEGMPWSSINKLPHGWDPRKQLLNIGVKV